MKQHIAQAVIIRRSILEDVFKDFNHSSRICLRRILEPLVWTSANRFAQMAAQFDEMVASAGFQQAIRQLLGSFVSEIDLYGVEHVPQEGPLLIISNHPGTYDSLAIAASLPRDDLNIIAIGYSLLRRLPAASRRLIFVEPGAYMNLSVVRSTIRHLRSGGSVLIFPRGRVEPDPAVLPGALESMQAWSPSLELFLREVPQTKALVTIVSGVLSPVFLQNPLIRFWRGLHDPQAIAEVTQIAVQMLFRKWVKLTPRISFNIPRTLDELYQEGASLHQSIVNEARHLLVDHLPMT